MREAPVGCRVNELVVLSAISAERETYGYAIWQQVVAAGIADLSEIAAYALLHGLDKRGLLSSRRAMAEDGREKRSYALTELGEALLRRAQSSWEEQSNSVSAIIASGRVT